MKNGVFKAVVVLLVLALAGALVLVVRGALSPSPAEAKPGTGSAENIDAILNAAEVYVKQLEPAKAEAILKEAIAKYPQEARLCLSYGELLVAQRRPGEAYPMYEKAIALGKPDAKLQFDAGTVASSAGKPDRAEEHYAAAQGLSPNDAQIPIYLAQTQLKLDKLTDAKKNLLLAANLDPEKAIVWGTLGEIALRENHAEMAVQHVAKARTLDPYNVVWRLVEARAKKRLGRAEEALQGLVGLSMSEQREPGVLAVMGECYGLLRRPEDAAGLYAKHAESEPTDAQLALDAAVWMERAGKLDEARRFAQRSAMLGSEAGKKLSERLGK